VGFTCCFLALALANHQALLELDEADAVRGWPDSRHSNPATYTGLLDPIRTVFAKANGVTPDLFSANSAGACPNCAGNGVIYTDLAMMASVATVCEECEGKRFQASVLEYRLAGRDISEVLAMSVTEALAFFGSGAARTPAARKILGGRNCSRRPQGQSLLGKPDSLFGLVCLTVVRTCISDDKLHIVLLLEFGKTLRVALKDGRHQHFHQTHFCRPACLGQLRAADHAPARTETDLQSARIATGYGLDIHPTHVRRNPSDEVNQRSNLI
jgi:hypothetical protein